MKKLLFTLAIGLATLISCESDLVSAPPSDSVGGVNDGVLLKKSIDNNLTSNYFYDGNKLIRREDSDGGSETYTYTNDLLTKLVEVFPDPQGVLDITTQTFEYNSDNKLIKDIHDGVVAYTYVHNVDGTITETESGGSVNVYTYENGNLMTQINTNGDNDYVSTYDANNNPYKNMHQREVFELLGEYAYANNLLTSNYTGSGPSYETITTTYTYNDSSYPITSVEVLTRYANSTVQATETLNTQYFYE